MISRWRLAVVAALLVLPLLALAGVGSYYLWTTGWWLHVWWPLAGCMAVGYLLGWHWQRSRQLIAPLDFSPQSHWTERDQQAWKLVEARAQAGEKFDLARLSDMQHYTVLAQEMAVELARVYHPKSTDPVGNLTVPELLAVVELASHDLADMIDRYLPGGHLLTVNDWKRAQKASEWYRTATNAYWLISAVFSPVSTGMRYAASKIGLGMPLQLLQTNLLLWFYTAFVHRLGTYLIELNSGRLRVGATRYRQRKEGTLPLPGEAETSRSPESEKSAIRPVTIAVLGQVKAGKSSLVNALVGERQAATDVLPLTAKVDRYTVQPAGIPSRLVLLDTPGYGHDGPKADQIADTRAAARESDLLLLVLHATTAGRAADVAMLKELRDWFAVRPDLKLPPIVAVLTHVDLLKPSLEWSPPYNWREPTRPKEVNIRDALAAAREQLGDSTLNIVPVRADSGKIDGVENELLPAIAARIDAAQGVALLRVLRADADEGKIRKIWDQIRATGMEAARIAWERFAR